MPGSESGQTERIFTPCLRSVVLLSGERTLDLRLENDNILESFCKVYRKIVEFTLSVKSSFRICTFSIGIGSGAFQDLTD